MKKVKIDSLIQYIDFILKKTSSNEYMYELNEIEDSIIKSAGRQSEFLDSLRKYMDYLNEEILRKESDLRRVVYYYRGQNNEEYPLQSGIYRSPNICKEDYYYHEMLVRCPSYFKGTTHLEKLVTMQHHGCPTRLLDITANPLVALYFACKEAGENTEDKNGKVYVFAAFNFEILYEDSDKALMLSCLPKLTSAEKEMLYEIVRQREDTGSFKQKSGGRSYEDEVVEKLFHEIATERPAFK